MKITRTNFIEWHWTVKTESERECIKAKYKGKDEATSKSLQSFCIIDISCLSLMARIQIYIYIYKKAYAIAWCQANSNSSNMNMMSVQLQYRMLYFSNSSIVSNLLINFHEEFPTEYKHTYIYILLQVEHFNGTKL